MSSKERSTPPLMGSDSTPSGGGAARRGYAGAIHFLVDRFNSRRVRGAS